MDFVDFIKYFTDYQICEYHPNNKTSSFRYETQKNQLLCFKFEVQTAGVYYFSVYQMKKRFFAENKHYKYSDVRLFVTGYDNDTGDGWFVGGNQEASREAWFKAECLPGRTYYVQLFTPWKSIVNQVTFAVYGPQEISLTKIAKNDMNMTHFTDVFQDIAEFNEDEGFEDFKDRGHGDIRYKFEDTDLGYGYFYFENNSKDTQLTISVKTSGTKGVMYGRPYDKEKTPMLIVGPECFEVLYYFKTDSESGFEDFTLLTTFTPLTAQIIGDLKMKSKRVARLHNGQDVGCSLSVLGVPGGQVWIYENKSENFVFKETVSFDLKGCAISGCENSYYNVLCWPGETKRIDITKVQGAGNWSAKAIKCVNQITEQNK